MVDLIPHVILQGQTLVQGRVLDHNGPFVYRITDFPFFLANPRKFCGDLFQIVFFTANFKDEAVRFGGRGEFLRSRFLVCQSSLALVREPGGLFDITLVPQTHRVLRLLPVNSSTRQTASVSSTDAASAFHSDAGWRPTVPACGGGILCVLAAKEQCQMGSVQKGSFVGTNSSVLLSEHGAD